MKTPTLVRIDIVKTLDNIPDTSWLGEYTDEEKDGVIVRKYDKFIDELDEDEEIPERGRKYRFFKPFAGGMEPTHDSWNEKEYKKYGRQDYDRMESYNNQNWCFIKISARALVELEQEDGTKIQQTIETPGIWGTESDSEDGHIQHIGSEELEQLREMLEAMNCKVEDHVWKRKEGFALDAVTNATIEY